MPRNLKITVPAIANDSSTTVMVIHARRAIWNRSAGVLSTGMAKNAGAVATAPAFLAMTVDNTPAERFQMARLACITMTVVLLSFAMAGTVIFKFLGITLPAFQ